MGCASSQPEHANVKEETQPRREPSPAQPGPTPPPVRHESPATGVAAAAAGAASASDASSQKANGEASTAPSQLAPRRDQPPAAEETATTTTASAASGVTGGVQAASGNVTPSPAAAPLDGSGGSQPEQQQEQQQQQQQHEANGASTAAVAAAAPVAAGTKVEASGGSSAEGGLRLLSAASNGSGGVGQGRGTWDKAKMMFEVMRPEELLNDLHDLKFIGAGGYGKVFKAVWRSAPVAVKLVPSHSPELFNSSSFKEALLCKELCHPNIVQTYETRCAQLTEDFVGSILSATTPPGQSHSGLHESGNGNTTSYGSQEFVSGDGFGLPSPVPDMLVRGKSLPEAAAKWKDILFTTGAKAGDFLTVIIMDFCDYGSLVRPIVKGMFRPFSASGSDREARVRYRALLRTAKEIAQGLEHLHSLRVVHGDLKPGNVLLKGSRVDVRGFNAQVIDFGLSHMVTSSNPQRVSKAGGTLVYAAPEVFSGVVGKAADVYSLGIILWEMVTGSQPYKDLNEGQIVLGVQRQGLRPAWPPGQLPQLQELYEKCVAQDLEARPKAKEVVQFLTQIEMDLRAELRAAHKRQQQAQALQQQQQQLAAAAAAAAGDAAALAAAVQQQQQGAMDQAQLLAAHQQAMAALQQQQQQQQHVAHVR